MLRPGYTVAGNGTIVDSTWDDVSPVIRMDSNPDDRLVIGLNSQSASATTGW